MENNRQTATRDKEPKETKKTMDEQNPNTNKEEP